MKQVATDVMGTMVIDDITNPSKPVKRRIDVLLKMCRSMMREKDHEISILKEQVEELTKKNVRLRNALVDMKGKTRIDAEDSPEETPTNTPAPKLVKEVKKVKRKQTKRTESNEVTRGAFPKQMRLKDEPIEMEIEINVEKQHLNNDNDRNNPSEQIAQEIDPLVIKEEREMDCEGDIRDVEAMDVLPICTEQMSCEKANLSRTNIIVQETSGTELWTIIKEEDVDLSE
ncbi:uncharacterized protein LOC131840744 [Achroia grisella]|uniref:uncharacterized protein LOC131840744 n=1 Tax=Achroia grisella TaxID=688607 RepID=UPI0027D277FF|nr:uncharacterized protein LOC131840744 [Achroia grisella]